MFNWLVEESEGEGWRVVGLVRGKDEARALAESVQRPRRVLARFRPVVCGDVTWQDVRVVKRGGPRVKNVEGPSIHEIAAARAAEDAAS